jgi:hypothetical protein
LYSDLEKNNVEALKCALYKLQQQRRDETESKFIDTSLRMLTTISGRAIAVEQWTVTAYEVESGVTIGSGGL